MGVAADHNIEASKNNQLLEEGARYASPSSPFPMPG